MGEHHDLEMWGWEGEGVCVMWFSHRNTTLEPTESATGDSTQKRRRGALATPSQRPPGFLHGHIPLQHLNLPAAPSSATV